MLDNYDPNVWKKDPAHPGYVVKTIREGNCNIQIYRPILSAVEQKKREAQVVAAASSALRSYYKQREENKNYE